MVETPGDGVRPTRAVLKDLDLPLPKLDVLLETLPHELLQRAQQVPELVEAGGAERIRALDDRIWFKVKTEVWRGASTRYRVYAEDDRSVIGEWWLCAAGTRRADTPQADFYEQLRRECVARKREANQSGRNIRTATLTEHLLPDDWDIDRLRGEVGAFALHTLQDLVRDMAAQSIRTGHVIGFDFSGAQIRLLIRAHEQIVYICFAATGITDAQTFALLLDSIPSISKDDWMPEPGGVMDLQPAHGEILWSAVLTPEAQAAILGDD